jgi:hypothetical protein
MDTYFKVIPGMKYFWLYLVCILTFTSIEVVAQKSERKKKFKPSSVCINEIYFHQENDAFTYRREYLILEWIEIFNGTSETIDLKDYFLTDNLDSLSKWAIHPISQRYEQLKKKKFFPVYVRDRAKRNGSHISDFYTNKEYIYLTKIENGTFVMVDTVKIPSKNQFPYSRYPDGAEFTKTNLLTPGTENMTFRDSESKNTYGVNIQLGQATATSSEFRNSSKPALAGGFGVYTRKNLGSFGMEYGIRFGIRGFNIDYHSTTTNVANTGIDEVRSKGRQTLYYIDLPYVASKGLFRNIDLFAGPMFSIKIKSTLSYTRERNFTPFDHTKPPIYSKVDYRFTEGNPALDLIDMSFIVGLRYQWHNNFNFSLYYMSDLTGLNFGSGDVLASQQSKGLFFSVGKPFYSGKKRVKKKSIF